MRVLAADFLTSATDPKAGKGWPEEGPPEIAFAGRSNVGKSTLLQALTQRRGLVRISSTPGRTRLINFFRVVVAPSDKPIELRFVDLPGFGYAKVSKQERKTFRPIVERFLLDRASLRAAILLVDLRRGAELDETELMHFMKDHDRRVIVVATKADKLSKHERKPAAEKIGRAMGMHVSVVSAESGDGIPALWKRILGALAPAGER